MPSPKPLAIRLLEQKKVPHGVFRFDDAIRSAQEVARVTGMPPEQVLKTLVVEHDPPKGKPYLVMVPSNLEIDLKVLAASLGQKKVRMATHHDAERHTGLQVGGISVLALLGKNFSVLIEESVTLFEEVLVSAGQRGFDVKLATSKLIELTNARPVAVTLGNRS